MASVAVHDGTAELSATKSLAPEPLDQLPKAPTPNDLIPFLQPILTRLLAGINYQGAPPISNENVVLVFDEMVEWATRLGLSFESIISRKAFEIGLTLGVVCYPEHPHQVQAYTAILTWLFTEHEDTVGPMLPDIILFQPRLLRGEPQPNGLLQGIADIICQAHLHFEDSVANMIQVSSLKFVTSNILEGRDSFPTMTDQKSRGSQFPKFYRLLSGIGLAYACFCFPKCKYPDLGIFLEAIPDMEFFVDFHNDVLSFYKEEVAGEKRNYIHNEASASTKQPLVVVEETMAVALAAHDRVCRVLAEDELYLKTWMNWVHGYTAFHTMNRRYLLEEIGLGDAEIYEPFKKQVANLFLAAVNGREQDI